MSAVSRRSPSPAVLSPRVLKRGGGDGHGLHAGIGRLNARSGNGRLRHRAVVRGRVAATTFTRVEPPADHPSCLRSTDSYTDYSVKNSSPWSGSWILCGAWRPYRDCSSLIGGSARVNSGSSFRNNSSPCRQSIFRDEIFNVRSKVLVRDSRRRAAVITM